MASGGCGGRRRFAVACGVLSHFVRAEAAAGKVAAEADHARPMAAASTMLLMPGADVADDDVGEDADATPAAQAQLTMMYGGRVLVFDDVPADRAAALARVAALQVILGGGMTADVPVARKGSLRRFMEKRRDRITARSPYGAAASSFRAATAASKKGDEGEAGDGCCLELGVPGGSKR